MVNVNVISIKNMREEYQACFDQMYLEVEKNVHEFVHPAGSTHHNFIIKNMSVTHLRYDKGVLVKSEIAYRKA